MEWIKRLKPGFDTIIGFNRFNYDPVVERAELAARLGERPLIRVPVPSETSTDPEQVDYYKLHRER